MEGRVHCSPALLMSLRQAEDSYGRAGEGYKRAGIGVARAVYLEQQAGTFASPVATHHNFYLVAA